MPLEGDDLLSPLTGTGHSLNDSFEESTYDWENASIGEDTVARESNDERIKLLQDEDENEVDVSQYSVRYEYLLWARPAKARR